MASFAEEYRPPSSSGSETLASETGSSDTYISDSESRNEQIKEKVCDVPVYNTYGVLASEILAFFLHCSGNELC